MAPRSRGGRNTRIHAIADAKGRILTFVLSGGEAHDCPIGAERRQQLAEQETKPIIPNRSNRNKRFRFDRKQHGKRHKIENAFCRLKDFRRIATRYDRLAFVFAASVYIAAPVAWWAE